MNTRRLLLPLIISLAATTAVAQHDAHVSASGGEARAKQWVESAVQSELAAAKVDHTTWTYRDHDKTTDKDVVYDVVETPEGELRRMVESNGQPVSAEVAARETQRLAAFIHDSAAQAKQRKASAHDDAQTDKMIRILPDAFLWRIKSETPDLITLTFEPDLTFRAPDIESRVLATMAGEVGITRPDNRIRTLRGHLTDDVKIGYGMLGKLRKGGTFDVERRELMPHIWQITETRVHIDGHALLFKTIGQQEDEIKTDIKPSTAGTLTEAARQLGVN